MKKTSYTDNQIRKHLDDIKKSIEGDVGTVLPVYAANMAGFFAIPRLLFPEIDGLGSFITGNPRATTENITIYLKLVMSKIDPRYAKYAAFITFVYRHGLLHQHTPKKFEYRKKDIGWMFNISHTNNPLDIQRKFHLHFVNNTLQLDMNVFYQDTFDSIDKLYEMLTKSYKEQFAKAISQQSTPLNKTNILNRNKKFIKASDFNFFKELK